MSSKKGRVITWGKKISEAKKGRPIKKWSISHREAAMKNHKGMLGKKHSPETLAKFSEIRRKDKHPNWKGGITPINEQIRHSKEYRIWREAVFSRDNWTCIWCGVRGIYIEADHIKPFCDYPELRFAIDNGRTLCRECHSKTENYKKRKWQSLK